jgi:hypothetical protein
MTPCVIAHDPDAFCEYISKQGIFMLWLVLLLFQFYHTAFAGYACRIGHWYDPEYWVGDHTCAVWYGTSNRDAMSWYPVACSQTYEIDGGRPTAPALQYGYYCPGPTCWDRYPCDSTVGITCKIPGKYVTQRCDNSCKNDICSDCPAGHFCPGDEFAYECNQCHWYNNDYESSACNGSHDAVCSRCIANSVSSAPAKSVLDCQCIPGYFGQVSGSTKVCMQCPANSTSFIDATSYLDCYCKDGYYGAVTGLFESTCQPCPPEHFCSQRCLCNTTL